MWAENKNSMSYNQGIPEGFGVNIRQEKGQTDGLKFLSMSGFS